jgi:hypothetical protein
MCQYIVQSQYFSEKQQINGAVFGLTRSGLEEEFEDTKGVIRICTSKKNRQHNGPQKKYKRTNNNQQNIHIKLKIE